MHILPQSALGQPHFHRARLHLTDMRSCTPKTATLKFAQAHYQQRLLQALCHSSAEATVKSTEQESWPHVPVLLNEVLSLLEPVSLQTFVDCTLGAGGHSTAVLQQHKEVQTYIGLDVDDTALQLAGPRLQNSLPPDHKVHLHLQQCNFRHLSRALDAVFDSHERVVDGILLDLGVSSMQLDTPERGFTFRHADAPLDMRLGGDTDQATSVTLPIQRHNGNLTAAAIVNGWSERDIGKLLREYGEEPLWKLIARRIVDARESGVLHTVGELETAVGRLPQGSSRKPGSRRIHPLTRTFQALRIAVNDELGAVEDVLPQALTALQPGGRLLVISFHSLEDRIVKRAMQKAAGQNLEPVSRSALAGLLQEAQGPPMGRIVTRKPITAGDDELEGNPRARSAKLRCFEKTQ